MSLEADMSSVDMMQSELIVPNSQPDCGVNLMAGQDRPSSSSIWQATMHIGADDLKREVTQVFVRKCYENAIKSPFCGDFGPKI